jgi:hypothetical protein
MRDVRAVLGDRERERIVSSRCEKRQSTNMAQPPTREQFDEMAKRGRMRLSEETTVTPTAAELAKVETPLDYGRLYGYSEDDIAHFYNRRRRGHQSGYEEYVRDLENPAFPVGYTSSGGSAKN